MERLGRQDLCELYETKEVYKRDIEAEAERVLCNC